MGESGLNPSPNPVGIVPPEPDWRAPCLVHPGMVLEDDYLKPLGITPYRLAKELHIPQTRVHEILKGKRGISADTALRLGRFFGIDPAWWLRVQASCELAAARLAVGDQIESIEPWPMPEPPEFIKRAMEEERRNRPPRRGPGGVVIEE
jgi:antitoxin HigA-1